MIWILAVRGASTLLRNSPFTETSIEGMHSVYYEPGVTPIPAGEEASGSGPSGTFLRGVHRISGFVMSYDGDAAETLLTIEEEIDLIIRYRANGQKRKRTLSDVLFVGDATVTIPSLNRGVSTLIAVPFRVQIPEGETVADHVTDELDS